MKHLVISYSPLGGGLLTGKYGMKKKPKKGRLLDNKNYVKRYAAREYYEITDRFLAHAKDKGVHPASLAVAWVMTHPGITAPIIGARSLEQLEPSLAALKVKMTPEWRAQISALGIQPPVATDRLEEQTGGGIFK